MEKRSSAIARLSAALALAAAVVTVVVLISAATSDDASHPGQSRHRSGQVKHEGGKKRSKAASYTVKSGDTLTSIAHHTGVPVPELLALNPEVDPQILIAGQTLQLR